MSKTETENTGQSVSDTNLYSVDMQRSFYIVYKNGALDKAHEPCDIVSCEAD